MLGLKVIECMVVEKIGEIEEKLLSKSRYWICASWHVDKFNVVRYASSFGKNGSFLLLKTTSSNLMCSDNIL